MSREIRQPAWASGVNASRRAALRGCAGALAVASLGRDAAAQQDWPSRPIRMIVPFPPGDGPDLMARQLAELLQPRLGQPFVIENQPGAGTTVAAQNLRRAAPDGYTVMLGGSTTLSVAPVLYPRLGIDPVRDFTLVCNLTKSPFTILVRRDGPATLASLLDAARRAAQPMTYGSAGAGSPHHLLASLLSRMARVELTHVPYRGVGPALTDLVAGRIDMLFSHIAAPIGFIQSGDLRALGVTPPTRLRSLPEVATMAELGFPGFENAAWIGIIAPPGLPRPIAQRLSREAVAILDTEEGRRRMDALFLFPDPIPFERLDGFVAAEAARWGDIVRASGAVVD